MPLSVGWIRHGFAQRHREGGNRGTKLMQNMAHYSASLHQLSSFIDSLEAAYRDCEARNDYRLFHLMSEGLLIRIRELNEEIRNYAERVDPEATRLVHV